jgi:glucosamine kinase
VTVVKGGLVVGIDAGGTKTRAFAVDRAGEVVGRGAGGGGNLLSSPDPQGSIGAALAEALGGRPADAIVLSCAGGDRKADRERGREILARVAPAGARLLVTHDALAALYAGNPAGCGVVLIAGTGSIAYGRNEEGEEDRAGGWGHLIGDEGSAVWCGLEALRAVAHAVDGRGAPTRLTALLFQELGVGEFGDVLPLLYGRPHPAPAVIAATRALAVAAAEGDALANGILQRGAVALARAANVVALTLGLLGGPVYLSGGAFESLPLLQRLVRLELLGALPQASVEPVREEPAMGAARMAMELVWSATA